MRASFARIGGSIIMHMARKILYAMDGAAKDHWTTEGYSVIEVESPLATDTVRRVANLQAGLRSWLIPQCGSSCMRAQMFR